MGLSIISFTEKGEALSLRLAEQLSGIEVRLFVKCSHALSCSAFQEEENRPFFVEKGVAEWAGEEMRERNALLFIGACGIAVRAVSPHLTDKLHDSAVLVMDEAGRYVIPILSGHMGGANELACRLAECIGAEAVLTTATDGRGKFAVDLFAKKNGLWPEPKSGIAKVSSAILAGNTVTMSVEPGHMREGRKPPRELRLVSYPPAHPVDIVVTAENGVPGTALKLRPREYVVGMGCKKGKAAGEIEEFLLRRLKAAGIDVSRIAALASISLKSGEEGLLAWCRKERIPFLTYTAKELKQVSGSIHSSGFVEKTTGVDNVCERAALKAAGPGGRLVCEKYAENGMTIAVAKREWSVSFEEI